MCVPVIVDATRTAQSESDTIHEDRDDVVRRRQVGALLVAPIGP